MFCGFSCVFNAFCDISMIYGTEKRAPLLMLLLGVGDGIASHFFVGLLEDVLAARIELAFDTLDDVVAAIGFHVTF